MEGIVDLAEPNLVEILIRQDGKVVWVNVNNQCAFRACRIKNLILQDDRATDSLPEGVTLVDIFTTLLKRC